MPRDQRPDRQDRLRYAIEAADRALGYVEGLDYAAFVASPLHQDAVLMQLMQVAENLKPLDDPDGDFRTVLPVAGRVFGLRNFIAHQYRSVETELIWEVLTGPLPRLREQLQCLHEFGDSSSGVIE